MRSELQARLLADLHQFAMPRHAHCKHRAPTYDDGIR